MNKKFVLIRIAAGLALISVVGTASWLLTHKESNDEFLTLFGNVDIRQVSLAFNGNDRITEMRVEEGDRVKAGQVLATLDTRILTLQIAQAEAQAVAQEQVLLRLENGTRPEEIAQARTEVVSAQADADLAKQFLGRLMEIESDSGAAVSKQDLDNARSRHRVAIAQLENRKKALQLALIGPRKEDIAQAKAQLNVFRAELALLQHQLDLAELKSPVDAVIRSRLLEPGDMASPQRPVYALAITDPKWVRAYVSEIDLGRIQPGMSAEVVTDSYPEEPIHGRIGYISSVAEFTPKPVQTEELRTSLVYEVRVYVEDAGDRLRLGMPATVHIALGNNGSSSEAKH